MILKMLVKSKFVLFKPRYYNYLLKKSIKKISILKDLFFEDVPLLSFLKILFKQYL